MGKSNNSTYKNSFFRQSNKASQKHHRAQMKAQGNNESYIKEVIKHKPDVQTIIDKTLPNQMVNILGINSNFQPNNHCSMTQEERLFFFSQSFQESLNQTLLFSMTVLIGLLSSLVINEANEEKASFNYTP